MSFIFNCDSFRIWYVTVYNVDIRHKYTHMHMYPTDMYACVFVVHVCPIVYNGVFYTYNCNYYRHPTRKFVCCLCWWVDFKKHEWTIEILAKKEHKKLATEISAIYLCIYVVIIFIRYQLWLWMCTGLDCCCSQYVFASSLILFSFITNVHLTTGFPPFFSQFYLQMIVVRSFFFM